MTVRTEQHKHEIVDEVAARTRERLAAHEADPAERFIRQFYARVGPDDVVRAGADNLYGAALSIWTFGARREPGRAKVRVYNPEAARDGWHSPHTVIEVVNDDMPFLVDSMTEEMNRHGYNIHLVIHPIVRVRRGPDGTLETLLDPDAGDGALVESFMHVEIDAQPREALAGLRERVEKILADVRVAVADWRAMLGKLDEAVAELEAHPPQIPPEQVKEATAFLRWMADDHFTLLGYREYAFTCEGDEVRMRLVDDSGLGILTDPEFRVFEGLRDMTTLPPEVRDFLRRPTPLTIAKSHQRATVHRAVPLDSISVKTFDDQGRAVGERRFVGLFTSLAYSQSPRETPLLREKVNRTMRRSGFSPGSHDAKALMHILETFPRDELFQISEDELYDMARGILQLQERQRIALFLRRDPYGRFVSCLIYVPRDRMETALRLRFQEILERELDGQVTQFYTQMTDAPLARLHFIVKTEPGAVPDYSAEDIEARLAEAGRTWSDHLRQALVAEKGEQPGLSLFRHYAEAFPVAFRERCAADSAVADIGHIEDMLSTGRLGMHLYRPAEADDSRVRFKIYHRRAPVPLSDVLPMLENMGLKVIGEIPYAVTPAEADEVWVHDFDMVTADGAAVELAGVRDAFHDAFARVWSGEVENDGFNRLVLAAGLDWREVMVLRAYCKYLRQTEVAFSQAYMEETLARNPELTRRLVRLFRARFDPREAGAAPRIETLRTEIGERLDAVESLDEDRILRHFLNLLESTLRTSFFQAAADGGPKPHLSLKLDSCRVECLPAPRPAFEVFVYSPRVEAVHLRGGKVARGGIRWSDRREDFRTEVLGLMKAQRVKNAVIVPVGAKGGFVVKRPPAEGGREALINEGIECYKTFMRGLLDLTDNLEGGRVVPPGDVVRHDDDDPYLVVAADKGTATFSDIANGIAGEYDFWLGDAFASGGSAGYDHKAMGITARGAWESVKRHFRELGVDIQNQDFTVVGIGDMAGDVFGNGMLCSRHIRLVGAFNHLHVFVDPDPDPAKSFEERKRLFETPRSQWTDYDRDLISRGGGVFDRKAKSVRLTPEMRGLFGIEADSVTPNELIRAMLRAPVDLLWFGGIGTFVKASHETHADADDRANDAVRVNARDLRCRVVGEGANLGVTQRGRVEFALEGGAINTDAIDNSAGVDCSDHEVNIKVALGHVVAAGDMTVKQRDALLERMTDDVAELVLRDNYMQTQAISIEKAQGVGTLDQHGRLIRALERSGRLDRTVEFLPDDEALAERAARRIGLTRPELAVLLAYCKIALYDALLFSDLPDDPLLERDLLRYFPAALQKKCRDAIVAHPLRREIIATTVTNSMVNRVGVAFVNEMADKTGMSESDIARAYAVTRDIFDLRDIWSAIEALDNEVPAQVQIRMALEVGALVERATLWFLRNGRHPLDITEHVEAYGSGIDRLACCLDDLLGEEDAARLERHARTFTGDGVPEALARRVASLEILVAAPDIVRIARAAGLAVDQVGRIYFTVGTRFGLDWLRSVAHSLAAESPWDKQAAEAIVDDLFDHQSEIAGRVLAAADRERLPDGAIETWVAERRHAVGRLDHLLADIRTTDVPDLAMLTVASHQVRTLAGGG